MGQKVLILFFTVYHIRMVPEHLLPGASSLKTLRQIWPWCLIKHRFIHFKKYQTVNEWPFQGTIVVLNLKTILTFLNINICTYHCKTKSSLHPEVRTYMYIVYTIHWYVHTKLKWWNFSWPFFVMNLYGMPYYCIHYSRLCCRNT